MLWNQSLAHCKDASNSLSKGFAHANPIRILCYVPLRITLGKLDSPVNENDIAFTLSPKASNGFSRSSRLVVCSRQPGGQCRSARPPDRQQIQDAAVDRLATTGRPTGRDHGPDDVTSRHLST